MEWLIGIGTLVGQLAPLIPKWIAAKGEERKAIEAEADAATEEWNAVRAGQKARRAATDAEVDKILGDRK